MAKPEFAIIECEAPKKHHHWCSYAEFLSDNRTVLGFVQCQLDQPFLVACWDADSGKLLKVVEVAPYAPSAKVLISPGRQILAVSTSTIKVVSRSPVQYETIGQTVIIDTATLDVRVTFPFAISEAALSHDGKRMAIKDDEDNLQIIDIKSGRKIASVNPKGYVSSMAFGGNSEEVLLLVGDFVVTWNCATGELKQGENAKGAQHAFSSDAKTLAHCKQQAPVVTDLTSGKSKKYGYTGHIRHLSTNADVTKLAIAADKTLVVWNLVDNAAWLKWKKPHFTDIRHAAFSPDGQRIACIMNHGRVHIFDFRTGAQDKNIERPKPNTGELQCLKMVGPDETMDCVGHYELLNPLPIACPACKRYDLDHVRSPYVLGRKVESPVDCAPAIAGNLLVRESMKRVLELCAPQTCKFYRTIHRKSKQPTPWMLAVPQHSQVTSELGKKCPTCGEPLNWNDVVEKSSNPLSKHEVFKAHNWWGGVTRNIYFSVRLETLVKKLGLRGMVRSYDCRNTPTTEDLKWVEEKMQLLKTTNSQKNSASSTATDRKWFGNYLKKNVKKKQLPHDFSTFEKKHHVKLPDAYKEFISKVGVRTFENVDGEEGFCVHILAPEQLRIEKCRERDAEEGEVFKGCHRADQNQPLVGTSKPATLRREIHNSFLVWFKGCLAAS